MIIFSNVKYEVSKRSINKIEKKNCGVNRLNFVCEHNNIFSVKSNFPYLSYIKKYSLTWRVKKCCSFFTRIHSHIKSS